MYFSSQSLHGLRLDILDFCCAVLDNSKISSNGVFLIFAIGVVDGFYIDTFDSGDRTVLFYFRKDDD